MLEQGIYNEIKNDTAIATKLANGTDYHIYPLVVPDDINFSMALTYTEIDQTLNFPNARTSIMQFNCIADTYDEALGLAEDINRIFFDKNEYLLGGVFGVKRTTFYGRTAIKDQELKKFIYVVEIYIKY
jgi:hypothetical protein